MWCVCFLCDFRIYFPVCCVSFRRAGKVKSRGIISFERFFFGAVKNVKIEAWNWNLLSYSSLTSLSDGLALERYRVIDHFLNSLFSMCSVPTRRRQLSGRSYARFDKTIEHVLYCIVFFCGLSHEKHTRQLIKEAIGLVSSYIEPTKEQWVSDVMAFN